MEIDRYQEVVNRLAKSRVDSRFSNKGPDHARIVVKAMFENASTTVNIFTGCLSQEFYTTDEVLASIGIFLNKSNSRLTILSEKEPDAISVEKIRKFSKENNVAIYKMNNDGIEPSENLANHFMTADGVSFRFEVDDAAREAIVNFNEPSIVTSLDGVYQNLKDKAFIIA